MEMMLLFYPPFRADSDEELLELSIIGARAYVEDLSEFPPDVLSKGWREVRRQHKVERWPTIEMIRSCCLGDNAPKVSTGRSETLEERLAIFRRSGMWMDSWGERPRTQIEKDAHHRRWVSDWRQVAPAEDQAVVDVILSRWNQGESAARLLDEAWGDSGLKTIPLLLGEKMGRSTAERVRRESLNRAEKDYEL